MIRAILGGGGNAEQSFTVDEFFVKKIPEDKQLLYIPIAMSESQHSYPDCFEWLAHALGQHSFIRERIIIWTDLANKRFVDIEQFGAIYIGGGNTYALLYKLRETGFIDILQLYIKRGGVVYGGSAGAIILSKDIGAASIGAYGDVNESGITNLNGLALTGKYAVHCHYVSNDDKLLRNYHEASGLPIIAIPEDSAVYVEDTALMVLGESPVVVFERHTERIVRPGARII